MARTLVRVQANTTTGKIELNKAPPTPITLTDTAVNHLKKLKTERGEQKTVLRVGVKSGGCSGMSYSMDFITSPEQVRPDDTVLEFEAGEIELRIDPKSLLYLFGLRLDYSNELIGGGYKFYNPNATSSCGCGTSFNV
jgi:iron-sulfur cluster assembly accessory protein